MQISNTSYMVLLCTRGSHPKPQWPPFRWIHCFGHAMCAHLLGWAHLKGRDILYPSENNYGMDMTRDLHECCFQFNLKHWAAEQKDTLMSSQDNVNVKRTRSTLGNFMSQTRQLSTDLLSCFCFDIFIFVMQNNGFNISLLRRLNSSSSSK